MDIKSIKSQDDGLNVIWNDGYHEIFPWLWIRDHSENEKDLHPDSKQRQIDVFSETPHDSVIETVVDQNSKKVLVRWADLTESSVSFNLLESMAKTSNPNAHALNNETCWNYPSEIKTFPKMTYDDFMSDKGLKKWLIYIQENGFVLVYESPANSEATKHLMEQMAYVRNSLFLVVFRSGIINLIILMIQPLHHYQLSHILMGPMCMMRLDFKLFIA